MRVNYRLPQSGRNGAAQLYDRHVRQLKLLATVIEDERQLDGSRHIEIVGGSDDLDAALRLVVDRDGSLQEAELSLDLDGVYTVLGFDQETYLEDGEPLSVRLRSADGEAEILQRDDGEIALTLTLHGAAEAGA